MKRVTIAVLALLLPAGAAAGLQDKKKPLLVALTKVPVKKGALRPGFDIRAEIPAAAWQGKLGSDAFLFLDLNADEKLEAELDGMVLSSVSAFVVPIPDKLLLKGGQYAVAFDGMKALTLAPDDLGSAQAIVADASVLTEIRARIGLRPFTLDAKASGDCEKHCDYMKANGLNVTGTLPVSPHFETEGKPGYSNEGAAAAANANIHRGTSGDLRRAVTGWYSTPYHGSNVINPALKRVGIAAKNNVCMLYFLEYGNRPAAAFVHPPDGSSGIPLALANGTDKENPNPVPGSNGGMGCGFPVTLRMDGVFGQLLSAELLDGSGRPVAGTISCPVKPANAALPNNMDCAFFIPSKPLAPNSLHKATFKLQGVEKLFTWSFTTGAK